MVTVSEAAALAPPFVWGIALIAAAALMAAVYVAMVWETHGRRAREMRRFGDDFVQEFARPWVHYRGAGPLPRTRLRINPSRARVEILVAPPPGRMYPNLSDHRVNVEYDVARVTAALQRDAFTSDQPYAEGEWVVLPFHFTDRLHKEGVR